MDSGAALKTNAKATKLMQPGQSALDHRTIDAQAAAAFSVATGNERSNRPLAQRLPMRVRVVAPVGVELEGTPTGSAHLAANGRNGIHYRQQLGNIVGIGRTQSNSER